MEKVNDIVAHPSHYCYSEYEPKDVIRAWGLNFNLGSAVKYISRAGRKDNIIQDLKKARQFIEFEIEALEKEALQTGYSIYPDWYEKLSELPFDYHPKEDGEAWYRADSVWSCIEALEKERG